MSFDAGLQKNNSLTLSTKTIGELSCEKPFFKLEMPISPVLKTLTNSSSSPSVSYEQITFPLSSPHIPILGLVEPAILPLLKNDMNWKLLL